MSAGNAASPQGFARFLAEPPGWVSRSGPLSNIVLSSRVRLARNLESLPFPPRSTPEQQSLVVNRVRAATEHIEAFAGGSWFDVEKLNESDLAFLIERRLISRDLATGDRHRGVLVGPQEALSLMVNEEDHLRLQGVVSGFSLGEALDLIDETDDVLDAHLAFAFSPRLGYLTACPTNVGTGMRASVLVHLPALQLTGEARKVLQGAAALGLAVRGFYGEGTEIMGNFVQISNQTTLGKDEHRIVGDLGEKVHRVIESEERARETVWRTARVQLEDKVYRAWGILRHARSIKASEVLNLASAVRLGLALEFPGLCSPDTLSGILVFSQPGHVTLASGEPDLTGEERRERRAAIIRDRIHAAEERVPRPEPGRGTNSQ